MSQYKLGQNEFICSHHTCLVSDKNENERKYEAHQMKLSLTFLSDTSVEHCQHCLCDGCWLSILLCFSIFFCEPLSIVLIDWKFTAECGSARFQCRWKPCSCCIFKASWYRKLLASVTSGANCASPAGTWPQNTIISAGRHQCLYAKSANGQLLVVVRSRHGRT